MHKNNGTRIENQIQSIVVIKTILFPSSRNGAYYINKWL